MGKKYSDTDLLNLIAEVEVEFEKHLNPAAEGEAINKKEEVKETVEVKPEGEFDYDAEDMAEMDNLYRSMSKAEAQAHFESLKKVVSAESEQKEESAPMTKSEDVDMYKSENEALKKENEEIKKNFNRVVETLNKVFKPQAPKQKSITDIEVIKKSEDEGKQTEEVSKLSKSEIGSKLSAKIRSGKLEKKDKDAIYKYYETNSIELVKHLL